jgi:RNA polymerase sigma-70 factor, ECF subfamily
VGGGFVRCVGFMTMRCRSGEILTSFVRFLEASVRLDGNRYLLDDRRVPRSDEDYGRALRSSSQGEHQAAVAELRAYLRAALGRSFGRQLSDSDLDDLTQESLLRIHAGLGSFDQKSRLTTWAISIAVRCALSELRRRRYRHVRLEDAAAEGAAALAREPAVHEGADELQLEHLRRGIREALTERQREVVLAKLGGLPLIEIARRLGTSQGAIYKLLHDARRKLKSHLEAAEHVGTAPGSP